MADEKRNIGQGSTGNQGTQGQGTTPGQTGGNVGQGQGKTGQQMGGSQSGGNANQLNDVKRQLESVDFPVSKTELVDQIGTKSVSFGGKNVNLKEVIGKLQKDRFQSSDELLREIQNMPEMKNLGGSTGGQMGGTQGGGQMGGQRGGQSGGMQGGQSSETGNPGNTGQNRKP